MNRCDAGHGVKVYQSISGKTRNQLAGGLCPETKVIPDIHSCGQRSAWLTVTGEAEKVNPILELRCGKPLNLWVVQNF